MGCDFINNLTGLSNVASTCALTSIPKKISLHFVLRHACYLLMFTLFPSFIKLSFSFITRINSLAIPSANSNAFYNLKNGGRKYNNIWFRSVVMNGSINLMIALELNDSIGSYFGCYVGHECTFTLTLLLITCIKWFSWHRKMIYLLGFDHI